MGRFCNNRWMSSLLGNGSINILGATNIDNIREYIVVNSLLDNWVVIQEYKIFSIGPVSKNHKRFRNNREVSRRQEAVNQRQEADMEKSVAQSPVESSVLYGRLWRRVNCKSAVVNRRLYV
jgi:hypothetical protein